MGKTVEHKPSLIIVDDEEVLLGMLRQALGEQGYECRTFTDPRKALEGLDSSRADVLITDIAMPGMRGLELTREAKRIRPDMIVIIMTGFVGDFSYDQAMETGASDFIKKPFTVQELVMRIKHVGMQEKLRTISITDELTGLLNRRGFFALAEQQMKLHIRTKISMALLFADLDLFKTINDTWGHQQGDAALTSMADIFRQTLRESDIIARMSGDEFAVLLMDTPESSIALITDRLQENIRSFNDRNHVPFKLSISLGIVAHDPNRVCTIDDLLKEADDLMYQNKLRKKPGTQGVDAEQAPS
jgi:diguanylate cyclase (GGDEF)-like protein